LIGPNVPITIPRVAQPVAQHLPDYEVELTIVIGKTAKDVPESQALDYVLGYTVGNDVSKDIPTRLSCIQANGRLRSPSDIIKWLRGIFPGSPCYDTCQSMMYFRTSQWTWSKSFDDTTPFGPVIVSAKAIPDPQKLPLKTEVNGKTLQDGNTAYEALHSTLCTSN
jgi:2-keto-4-pentenoate hydratase/2-oxohepta-3-ene-1,7-dioic acid hydratase in catechol pathway